MPDTSETSEIRPLDSDNSVISGVSELISTMQSGFVAVVGVALHNLLDASAKIRPALSVTLSPLLMTHQKG